MILHTHPFAMVGILGGAVGVYGTAVFAAMTDATMLAACTTVTTTVTAIGAIAKLYFDDQREKRSKALVDTKKRLADTEQLLAETERRLTRAEKRADGSQRDREKMNKDVEALKAQKDAISRELTRVREAQKKNIDDTKEIKAVVDLQSQAKVASAIVQNTAATEQNTRATLEALSHEDTA